MIIIEVENKGSTSIDRALRKFKKKIENTKMMRQLRERKEFTKPSEKKRADKRKAIYIKKKYGDKD